MWQFVPSASRHCLVLTCASLVVGAGAVEPKSKTTKELKAEKETAKEAAKEAAPLLLDEQFEQTEVGHIPTGFTKEGAVGVAEDAAHNGRRALRVEAAPNGRRRITINDKALMTALGGEHWGRLFFRVQLPVPTPKEGSHPNFPQIHSTLVAGFARSPQFGDGIDVRMLDTVLGPNGTFQYLYNVQPDKRPEFATATDYVYKFTDEWTLAEWHIDHAAQRFELFIDGVLIPKSSFNQGAGKFEKAEVPEIFESLSFGWNNYQKADPGFVAWIDDIALSKDRVGLRGLPPPPSLTERQESLLAADPTMATYEKLETLLTQAKPTVLKPAAERFKELGKDPAIKTELKARSIYQQCQELLAHPNPQKQQTGREGLEILAKKFAETVYGKKAARR
jgi:hypothetical protein